jgi:hypothetical protein
MTGEVQPQDKDSGLVVRTWTRREHQKKRRNQGDVTEQTLEGEDVQAAWMDAQGQVRRAAGKVIRNAAGELVIESWADGIRRESAVTRDANVDVIGRPR